MFNKLTRTMKDMETISALCIVAERIANAEQQRAVAAEHFVLAALELPDGSARRVFDRLGLTAEAFREALRQRHRAALAAAGVSDGQIAASERDVPPLPKPKGLYQSAPSAESVLKGLSALRKRGVVGPLIGVHVLEVVVAMAEATTMGAFRLLERDPASVLAAIRSEMVMVA
jgi:hypothetical protein